MSSNQCFACTSGLGGDHAFWCENAPKRAKPAQQDAPTDAEWRLLWKANGGSFHGPNVETATMPEEKLFSFLRWLTRAPAQNAERERDHQPSAGDAELPYPSFYKAHEDVCGDEVGPATPYWNEEAVRAAVLADPQKRAQDGAVHQFVLRKLLEQARNYTRHPDYDWDLDFQRDVDAALATDRAQRAGKGDGNA